MSTGAHRAIELLVGSALVGYCAYSIYAGRISGKFRSYDRNEEPWSFWTSVVLMLAISAAFLFGFTSWRD